MKTKTYILTLSRTFPKGHPREGEETRFTDKMRGGIHYGPRLGDDNSRLLFKLHTIRAEYDLWKRRIDEVNAGEAVLSVREWLGAPRRSKQGEIFRFGKDSGIGVEMLKQMSNGSLFAFYKRGQDSLNTPLAPEALAANDGLTLADWLAWFRGCDKSEPMAIIHFTSFRYCK